MANEASTSGSAASPSKFVWYELMTTDMAAAEAFYASAVGWTPQPMGQPGKPYTVMHAGAVPAAGVMPLPEDARGAGARPGWVGYIYAEDVDAATERLKAAGGKVHRQPDDIPGVGRFSAVADPQGAAFMLFTPKGGDNAPAPPGTPGHAGWHELYAADWASAFDFYASQFGWTKDTALDMGAMGTYQLFAAGGPAVGGMMTKPAAFPAPAWLFYFNVAGLDAAIARLTAAGGSVMHGPTEVPGSSWIVQAMDPQGVMFALVAPRR